MWGDLEEVEKKIKALEDRALVETEPSSAYGRELSTFLVQELECGASSFEERRVTFYNGDAETLCLSEVSVNVFYQNPTNATYADFRVALVSTARGFTFPASLAWTDPFYFDFYWNYAVNSRQSLYSRDYLSSSVLASGTDRAQMFSFDKPIRLVPSDSIELRVLPTLLPIPAFVNSELIQGASLIVSFAFLGYRSAE
jgi:hypothetical protein